MYEIYTLVVAVIGAVATIATFISGFKLGLNTSMTRHQFAVHQQQIEKQESLYG